jgi:DNA gyrase subunit A
MRYTEARLAGAALDLTSDLDEDVVDFVPNYDGRENEPNVLPAAFPNLLVNGASGIAVGMATNLVAHNLAETIAAARHLIQHPDADLETIMTFIPGPDLPGGGVITGLDGIKEAYASGKGSFRVRARTRVEQVTPRRKGIVVTELPPGIGPERVIEKIKDAVQSKKMQGIADVVDLTDGESGLHLVIELKSGFVPDAVLEQLYRLTPIEEAITINAVALVNGQPETLGLLRMLHVFLDHRFEVVRRRSAFRKAQALSRLHLVDGLLIAMLDIDEVIALIRASDDTASARTRLQSVFDLSEIQSAYILEMPLRRLTKFSRIELEKERDELNRDVAMLSEILENDARLRSVVSDELSAVSHRHASPRRTLLLEGNGLATPTKVSTPLEVADEPCVVLLSSTGLIARTPSIASSPDGPRAAHDVIVSAIAATTRSDIGLLTSLGRVIRLATIDLPSMPAVAGHPALGAGAPLGAFIDLPHNEVPICLLNFDENSTLALGTAQGIVKRVVMDVPSNKDSWEVIRLEESDVVVGGCSLAEHEAELLEACFITSDAQLLIFQLAGVRPQGRAAGGIAGIKLGRGASVVYFGVISPSVPGALVTISGTTSALPGTEPGSLKVTTLSSYPRKGRATQGVRCHKFRVGEDAVLHAWAGAAPAFAATASGVPAPMGDPDDRRDGTGSPAPLPISGIGTGRLVATSVSVPRS